MQDKRMLELWVGIFVASGLVALAVLAFQVGDIASAEVSEPYQLKARFSNIGGLKVKSPVTVAGVRIGRVAKISFDHDRYQALVTLSIDGRYKNIPSDASASILTSGLLGEQYIGIEPGGSEEYLRDGGEIQLTQSALVLENLIGQFMVRLTEGSGNDKSK
ncbi:MAG: outer membrane lipid asymmetry maintenance protein MlaD [Acidiferrobacterales bacterium]